MPQFYAPPPKSLAARLAAIRPILADSDVPGPVLEFESFEPDRAPLGSPGSPTLTNGVPVPDGFGPQADFSADTSTALDGRARGLSAAQNSEGVVFVHAGDDKKLYYINAAAEVSNVSKSGGYDGADDGGWEFTLDNLTVIATNYEDAIQSFTLGTSTLFADHITSTNKPKARHIDIVRDQFLVMANTNDTTDGVKPSRVWWSAAGDTTDADPDAATLCDFQDVKGAGWAQKVVGGVEYGLVFFENAIERMDFVGGGEIFSFNRIDRKRGTEIPGSVIAQGRRVFYHSPEGFMMTEGTGESIPIGHGRVDKWFDDQFDLQYRSRVTAAIDPLRKLVYWGFPGTGSSGGTPNILAIYNYVEDKWGEAEITHEILLRSMTQGLTLDGLDTISTDLDALAFSLDSRAWSGGTFKLAGFNTSNLYGFFDGANLAATLTTGEKMLNPGYFTRTTGMLPMVDAAASNITGAIGGRNRTVDSVSFDTAQSLNTDGIIPANNSSRYVRGRMIVAAGASWNHAQGLELLTTREGVY